MSKQFIAGRVEALCETKDFITENFIDNLPRRLKANLENNNQ